MSPQDAVVAGRYAKALFLAARDAKASDEVRRDLKDLSQALRTRPALTVSLGHPRRTIEEKQAQVKSALGRALHALTGRFIELVLSRKRLAVLSAASALFEAHDDEARGVVRVQARAASALSPQQLASLTAGVEKAVGAKVAMETVVDPALLGGVVVRAGDRLWDLSLKGRLASLREKLLETALN